MHVLVTGAAGQLGSAIVRRFSEIGRVTALTRDALDITKPLDVLRIVSAASPHVIVNCSAYNEVDRAEDDVVQALDVNAFGVLALARAAREVGAALIHYSTDFVFDGLGDRPYMEDDAPGPQSTYGRSKLLGEWFAGDAARYYILRVESLFGGQRAKSSIDRILAAIRAGEPAKVFVDRTVTPSYVVDVAEATVRLVEIGPPTGVYHCVNSGVTTWFDLAKELAAMLHRDVALVPTSVTTVSTRAKRPRYCAMSNEKLRTVGIEMPHWTDALVRHVAAAAASRT